MSHHVQIVIANADEAYKLLEKYRNSPDTEVVFNIGVKTLPKYISTQQVMEMIDCSRRHVYDLISKGIIKRVQSVAGANRFEREHIQELINEGLV